jgi:hypothetical protein
MPKDDETISTAEQIRQEISQLLAIQSNVLADAVYTGMSATQAREYDARRNRITELVRRLEALGRS